MVLPNQPLLLGTRTWHKVMNVKHRLRCKNVCFYCIEDFSGSLEAARWTHLFLPLAPKAVQTQMVCATTRSGPERWLCPPIPSGGTVKAILGRQGMGSVRAQGRES